MVDDVLIILNFVALVTLSIHHCLLLVSLLFTHIPRFCLHMAPRQRLLSRCGGALGSSSSRRRHLFGWDSMANHFDLVPFEVRNEILQLEVKEFGDQLYFFTLRVVASPSGAFLT